MNFESFPSHGLVISFSSYSFLHFTQASTIRLAIAMHIHRHLFPLRLMHGTYPSRCFRSFLR